MNRNWDDLKHWDDRPCARCSTIVPKSSCYIHNSRVWCDNCWKIWSSGPYREFYNKYFYEENREMLDKIVQDFIHKIEY